MPVQREESRWLYFYNIEHQSTIIFRRTVLRMPPLR